MKIIYLLCCLFVVTACFRDEPLPNKVEELVSKGKFQAAEQMLQDEIKAGNVQAKGLLAYLIVTKKTPDTHRSGGSTEKLRAMARPLLEAAAAQGDAMAQYLLAQHLLAKNAKDDQARLLMEQSAAANYLPAMLYRVVNYPTFKYNGINDKYLPINLANYSLVSAKNTILSCKELPMTVRLPQSYIDKLKLELSDNSKEITQNIIRSAKCFVDDLNKIKQSITENTSVYEGRFFYQNFSWVVATQYFKKSQLGLNPDVMILLGDISVLAKKHLKRFMLHGNNLNNYENAFDVEVVNFYYQAIVTAEKYQHFEDSANQARVKLSDLADNGSIAALNKLALVTTSYNDIIDNLKRAAHRGNVEAMRQLGKAYHKNGNIDEAVKWLQFAAYAFDPEAMGVLSDLWENSKQPNEQVLGVFWGLLAAEFRHTEQEALYVEDKRLAMQEIINFLQSLKDDARGKKIPQQLLDIGLELHTKRAELREKQQAVAAKISNNEANRLEKLHNEIKKGNSAAMLELGKRYYDGAGVATNKAKAFQLFQQAEKSQFEAKEILTLLLASDDEIKTLAKEQKTILGRYDEMAKLGNQFAINYLIEAYSTGLKAPYDREKAMYYRSLLPQTK